MRILIKTIGGLIFCLAVTTGCGQKGPLYLPGDPAAMKTDVPGQYQSQPSSEETDEDTEDEDDDKQ